MLPGEVGVAAMVADGRTDGRTNRRTDGRTRLLFGEENIIMKR